MAQEMNTSKLFAHGWNGKTESHWVMCLAAYKMYNNGGIEKVLQEYELHEQTVVNYAKTFWLYDDLRKWVAFAYPKKMIADGKKELRELRRDVHYSKWNLVSVRYFHEDREKRIDPETALNFLRAGMDTSVRVFAGVISANDLTRSKAFTSAANGLKKALTFPMTKRDKRILKKALLIAEKRKAAG